MYTFLSGPVVFIIFTFLVCWVYMQVYVSVEQPFMTYSLDGKLYWASLIYCNNVSIVKRWGTDENHEISLQNNTNEAP